MKQLIYKIIPGFILTRWKENHELKYWYGRKIVEGELSNNHYTHFYTTHFGLDFRYYKDKKILDIGCGPRGSLEWADMTKERVGLDPLADKYIDIAGSQHKMKYVNACSENIPYKDNYFDVITSFNSIDHVIDINAAIHEIKRVLKPGGFFLLLTDLNHNPTICEPQSITWNIVELFLPEFEIIDEKNYERSSTGLYNSIQKGIEYNHMDKSKRYGVLSAKFIKKELIP